MQRSVAREYIMFLKSNRIHLIRFTERHITPEYVSWLNDSQVNQYLYTGRIPISKGQLNDPNDANNIMFAIMTNLHIGDGFTQIQDFVYYIGTCSINSIDYINRRGEIGYMIGSKKYWRRGIATEVISLISDYAFNRLNLYKIEASVVDGHDASIKALEANKFKEYGIKPEDYFLNGMYLGTHKFYKLQNWNYQDDALGEE